MTLSKSFFIIPAVTSLVIAAVASGACSSSVSVTVPPSGTAPTGFVADGWEVGQACSGDVYVSSTDGYLYCGSDDVWVYTATDPASDGYTAYTVEGSDSEGESVSESESGSESESVSESESGSESETTSESETETSSEESSS